MISKDKITLEWLDKVSSENRNADKILIEKVIRALLLLEGLVKQKLSFVFKGGTALMLHMNTTKRLSIDIDIILPVEQEDLDEIFELILKEQGFIRYELQHRDTNTKIKKEHYKFYYNPVHKTIKEDEYILLDILFEEVNYEKILELPVESAFAPAEGDPVLVKAPSLEDILGDKLTAFAPETTGIPYFKNDDSMSMEIMKQLYDIGKLAGIVDDAAVIKNTFKKFADTELDYRDQNDIDTEDVLEDIFQTSLSIATRGTDGKGNFEELQLGVRRVSSFIFSENYHLEKAIVDASKAAYLSALIKYNAETIEKFGGTAEIRDWEISAPMNTKLNKLKKSNPEAFFYWYKIYELSSKGIK